MSNEQMPCKHMYLFQVVYEAARKGWGALLHSKIERVRMCSQILLQTYYVQYAWCLSFHEHFAKIDQVTAHASYLYNYL